MEPFMVFGGHLGVNAASVTRKICCLSMSHVPGRQKYGSLWSRGCSCALCSSILSNCDWDRVPEACCDSHSLDVSVLSCSLLCVTKGERWERHPATRGVSWYTKLTSFPYFVRTCLLKVLPHADTEECRCDFQKTCFHSLIKIRHSILELWWNTHKTLLALCCH